MQIKIVVQNRLDIVYIVFLEHRTSKLVRVNRGHPIFKSTITKQVYELKSTEMYRGFL